MFVFTPEIDTTSGVPDPKPETSAADVFAATLQAADQTGLHGADYAMESAADRRNDAIFKATGERLENPMRVYQLDTPDGVTRNPRDPLAVDAWQAKLQDLAQRYPQYRDVIQPDVPLFDAGKAEVQRSTASAADTWERAPNSIGAYAAYVGGSLASGAKDPLTWATGPLFPEIRASAGAAGLAWAALKTGTANAALTAAEQPFIQAWRKEAGLDYGIRSAAEETALSFLVGAALDPAVRVTGRGFRKLQGKVPVLNDAGEVIGYKWPDARSPRDNPLQALEDAASAAPEGSLIRKAQAGDREALTTLAEKTGLHEVPEVRAALEVLGREEAERVPPAGVAIEDHVQRFNDAMRASEDPRALPPGNALEHAPDVTAAPERIAEVMDQDPVSLAAEIRDTPELLQEGLPWQDPQLRAAAHLSRLSDGAFDMVAGGEVHPMLGAIVAEHVADADLHAGLLTRLAEAEPKTPQAARALLADLLVGPKNEVAHARVAGVADELVDRPIILVDDPHGRDAGLQLEQLRREHAAEISAAGGVVAREIEERSAETGQSLARLEKKVAATEAAHDRLAAALDKALGRLPAGVEVKSFADIADLPEGLRRDVLAARSAGQRPKALFHPTTSHIWIAQDALLGDFADQLLSHETIHALRFVQRIEGGKKVPFLSDDELKLLASKAAELDVFTPEMRSDYEQLYRERNLSDEDLAEHLDQEAAAHLFQARAAGANAGKEANGILRRISQFLERAKNALQGLGFQNADDIMKAIDDGIIASRARRAVDMPGGGQVEGLPLFSLGIWQRLKSAIAPGRDPETVARSFSQIAKDKPKVALDEFELRRMVTSRGGGVKYDVFDGAERIASLTIDAPKRLSPTMLDLAMATSFERLDRAQPIAGTVTRIEVNENYQGKGLASRMLDVAERDLNSSGAILHPGDTSMTQDFMNLYAKRDPGMMQDAFARMGVGSFDDPALMLSRAMRAREARSKDGGGLFSLKAYHGTPHEVDRFRSDRIGTGEGAQAYGIGLYFAESEAVARQYRDMLSALQNRRPFFPPADGNNPFSGAPVLERDPTGPGHIYQVELDADPEHLIDWDKPLNEQSDYVRAALKVPKSEALQKEASDLHRSLHFLKSLIEPSKAHKAEMRQIEARLQKIDPNQSVQWKALATTPEGAKKLSEAGIAGIRYLDGVSRSRGIGTSNYVIFDDSKIKITHVDGQPASEPSNTGGALFSLRDDAREQLKADLAEVEALADAKAKAQRERQALIDEGIRKKNERFVTTLRDARGQVDPAKALVYLLENHGQVDLPEGMTSVAAEHKAVEAMLKAQMEEALHTFRPQLLTGHTRQTARLANVVREMAGEGTGDAAAKGLAQSMLAVMERSRQLFNAAGGDIPKLEGWFLPQVHDRGALLGAGKTKWVNDIFRQLDLPRIVDGETRQPLSREEIRKALGDIWENITSDGHGTQAANAADPFGGITGDPAGAKKLANQRQEHRFLHFKSADDWMAYQKQYGGGADPFRAVMQHLTSMSKDIAAMRVLGTNPNRELSRLARFAMKQAKLARPAAVLIDEAVAKVQDLTERYLSAPTRLSEVNDRIGALHKDIARLREKRLGPPSKRNKKKIEGMREELFRLDAERLDLMDKGKPRVDGLEGAALRAELTAAYDELAGVQDVDKVLFPKKTEILGKTMTHRGFWTTAPEDYANSSISRAEAMWDLYRGVTSAPVNAKAAETMQMLRNVGVIGRGGSMVISSIADNFTQVMARRFTGLPAYKTFTDILGQLGPNAKREAHRQALIGETYLHMFNDGARGAASVQGPAWSNYLAERTIALQGLGALTDAQRQAFGMSLQGAMADLAAKSWGEIGDLNPRLHKLFQRYGINAADWDAIRLDAATRKPRDVDFLSPNLVQADLEAHDTTNAARRVAERYLGMILQETDFASPTAMLRARAMMVGKTRAGTLVGELLRTGGQFKSFAFMYWMLHAERSLREGIANGTLKGASYAAQVVTVTTLGGALVVQLKDLKGGKDTRPMDRPGFWYAALMQGGGLGIWGDLLNSEQNRFGGGLVSTLGGPVVGIAEDVLGAAGLSGKTTVRRGTARLATSYVPGSSLWYANLAWQRIAAESLQRQLDPTAYDAFRRRQASQLKDYGNGFWWAPGDTAPRRGPRVN